MKPRILLKSMILGSSVWSKGVPLISFLFYLGKLKSLHPFFAVYLACYSFRQLDYFFFSKQLHLPKPVLLAWLVCKYLPALLLFSLFIISSREARPSVLCMFQGFSISVALFTFYILNIRGGMFPPDLRLP